MRVIRTSGFRALIPAVGAICTRMPGGEVQRKFKPRCRDLPLAAWSPGWTTSVPMRFSRMMRGVVAALAAWSFACAASTARSDEISVQQAIAKVQRQTRGKVLGVQTLTLGKHRIYRIKVLTPDGQVRVIQVSAEE
jgi:hypothetical protein